MKPKMKLKLSMDFAMTILLFGQMAYMRIGEAAHEWLGAAMCLLFILHHALNWKWHKNLVKRKYSPMRIFQTIVVFLMLLSMLGLMVSGIIMSRTVFAFLPIRGGMGFARILHMLAAYWGFILMSLHLGLHWGMVMGMLRKMSGKERGSGFRTWILRGTAFAVSAFGVFSFYKNNIASYLFLKNQFVFFDMEQPLALFFAEYASMMALWVCLAYYGGRLLQRYSARKGL